MSVDKIEDAKTAEEQGFNWGDLPWEYIIPAGLSIWGAVRGNNNLNNFITGLLPKQEPVGGEYGNEFMSFWESQMEELGPILDHLAAVYQQQFQWAEEDRARWSSVFKPLEDALVADAETFATEARRNLEAERAASTVGQSMVAAQRNAQRQLEEHGIDPSQTRAQALNLGLRLQQGAAQAAAKNTARRYVDEQGRALRNQAIALGQDTANRALGESQLSGQTALGAGDLQLKGSALGLDALTTGTKFDFLENAQKFDQALKLANFQALYGTPEYGFTDAALDELPNVPWGTIYDIIRGDKKDDPNSGVKTTPPVDYEPYPQPYPGWPTYATGGPVGARSALPLSPPYDQNGTVEGLPGATGDRTPALLEKDEFVLDKDTVAVEGLRKLRKMQEAAQEWMAEDKAKHPPKFVPAPRALMV